MATIQVPSDSEVATGQTTREMAEPPADSPNKLSEGPMATEMQIAQPRRSQQQNDNTDMHMTSGVECAANRAVLTSQYGSEAREPARELASEDVPAIEGLTIDGTAASAAEDPNSQAGVKKKKKTKRIPKSRRGISGFEEYYADAPMTPAEAAEKKKLYDPARPFADRIEECIQRFRFRRRLDSQRAAMFNKYLFLGGIDSSQRQFTGMAGDRDVMAEADSEQIRTMTAVDFIMGNDNRFYNPSNSDDWEVDFEAVAKGFLSRTITDLYMYDAKAIQIAADLIKNFLNYVLMHDVCPEYTSNVVAARNVCDIAPTELRQTHELILELPGTFNCAARSLFCEGRVESLDDQENYEALVQFRLTTFLWSLSNEARKSKQRIMKAQDPTTIKVISTTEETYQILEIERPRHKDKMAVDEQLKKRSLNGKLKPAGFIRVVPAIMEHGWGNVPRPEEVDLSDADEEEFVLEDELLTKFEVGMKIHMTVCELNVGLRFIKEVHDIRVSFDTFLPQYLMANWKDPVPNERPPPSIHDPDAEERVLSAETED
ncbi:hypothetical protein O1611_g2693 [Lasiodiplodia mahajangana]|uniref:Uncharacterized protein n=1 Tax=Lasiodiplodia mahajangana TaxID=1108764 RepID=A0ACC2JU53_9PEZI|nr:hypothetical protein O1611_g2693 [Lasiodiplodia mahajangana]